MKLILSVLIALTLSATAEKARFDNYRVYKISVDNKLQLDVLRELSEVSDSYNFWEEPTRVGADVDLIVPPHQFAHFSELVERYRFKVILKNNNLQESIDLESPQRPEKAAALDWVDYHDLSEIYDWLEEKRQEFPEFITIIELGTTFEGRSFKMVKLSKQAGNRGLVIEAQIHAREWIAGATATYFLNELLYSTDPDIQEISRNVDWYIIPITNPDGFEYTRTNNRNWRKTRSPVSLVCFGADPNRNFAHSFRTPDEKGDLGASTAPCSDTYSGPYAFSEPETLAVENFLGQTHGMIDVYISFHSYAHMLLHPYGHSVNPVSNYDQLQAVGIATAERLASVYGTVYQVGSPNDILYAASGISVDHAYGRHGIPIAYTYEMRGDGDYGSFGFFLPPEFIIPNAEEITESLVALVHKTREFGFLGIPAVPADINYEIN